MDGSVVFARLRQYALPLHASLGPRASPHPKQHLDRFSSFCTAHDTVTTVVLISSMSSNALNAFLFTLQIRLLLTTVRVYKLYLLTHYILQLAAPFLLKIAPSLGGGIWTPCNTWFLGLTREHNPNGISIGSAIFAGLTILRHRLTDRPRYSVCNNRPHLYSTAMRPDNKWVLILLLGY